MDGGGLDAVFAEFVGDVVRFVDGGGEDEDLRPIPLLEEAAEEGAFAGFRHGIGCLCDLVEVLHLLADLHDHRILEQEAVHFEDFLAEGR